MFLPPSDNLPQNDPG